MFNVEKFSELIFSLCKNFGTKVVIVDAVQDVIELELMTVFSAKLYGRRSHKNKKSIIT